MVVKKTGCVSLRYFTFREVFILTGILENSKKDIRVEPNNCFNLTPTVQVKQMLAREPAAFNKSKADKLREEKEKEYGIERFYR
jgi:hypothetical protein